MKPGERTAAGVCGAACVCRMLDGLSDPCLVAGAGLRLIYANEAARDALQFKGRVTGRRLASVLLDRQAVQMAEEALAAGRPRTLLLPLTLSSTGERLYEVSAVPFAGGDGENFLRVALRRRESSADGATSSQDAARIGTVERLGDPLTIIQGYLENLLDGHIKDPVVMRQCLSAMQRQTAQIQRILGALRT